MSKLLINEIFYSIQGESSYAGLGCVFIRLKGCHLRCHYCDTAYAFHEGRAREIDEIIAYAQSLCDGEVLLYQITGGEPLLQKGVHELIGKLCDGGKRVLIETSGACDISVCDARSIRILDFKTPGSGECDRNDWGNVEDLRASDEVKFVLTDEGDYVWMKEQIQRYDLHDRVDTILVSAAAEMAGGKEIAGVEGLDIDLLAGWILADRLDVRLQTQLHKIIWDPQRRGV